MKRRHALSIVSAAGMLSSIGAAISVSGAAAQQSEQASAAGAPGLEEIVVTARRRQERIQSVPIAISAFTQKDLEQRQISQVQDFARAVPSLGVSQPQSDQNAPASGQLNLRGLAGTVIYFADVPIGTGDLNPQTGLSHGKGTGLYYDLDNVQIIKGPQGTLFGKNSIGGLIALDPKRPTNDYEGYAQVALGNFNDHEFEGAVNLPVIRDKLLVRIAGQSQTRDGYTKVLNTGFDLDDRNYQAWRVGITVRPSDDFENYFVYDGYWQHSNGSSTILSRIDLNHVLTTVPAGGGKLLPITFTGSGPLPNFGALGYVPIRISLFPTLPAILAQQQGLGVRTQVGLIPPGIGKDYFYGFTDNARWDIADDLVVKNIASARVTKTLATVDDSGTALPILTFGGDPINPHGWLENNVQYTEELQLQGKSFGDRLNWVAGGYLDFAHPLGTTLIESIAATALSFNHYHNTTRSQALFAHGIYDLSDFVEGLRFTAGYRYTWDFLSISQVGTKGVDRVTRNAAGAPTNCTTVGVDVNCVGAPDAHYSAPGWNLSLDEQLTPDTLIYVRSGNAYRPGGINLAVPPAFQEYQPEHVTDVELGIKSEWFLMGVEARTNFDAFHTDYKSIQVPQLVLIPDENGGTPRINNITRNSAGATIEGAEFDGTFIFLKNFELSPQFSYVYARYDQYPPDAGTVAKPPFLYFPKLKYSIAGTYHIPMDESLGNISVTAIYSFNGQQYDSNLVGEPFNITPSHDQLDMRIDWNNVLGRSIDAAFFMTNVTDNTYVAGVFPIYVQFGYEALTYNAPRMYGFTLRWRFGPGLDSGL